MSHDIPQYVHCCARELITPNRIKSRVATVLRQDVQFNEILSVMYREGQKMSWHDDGEDGKLMLRQVKRFVIFPWFPIPVCRGHAGARGWGIPLTSRRIGTCGRCTFSGFPGHHVIPSKGGPAASWRWPAASIHLHLHHQQQQCNEDGLACTQSDPVPWCELMILVDLLICIGCDHYGRPGHPVSV